MSLNKVILIGNVGKDPEVRYVEQNRPVANFSLATSERGYKSKSGVEIPERTDWHNIVVWNDLAKFVEAYVKKGSSLYIEGKIRTRSYQAQDNSTRYVTEIYADKIEFFGSRPGSGQSQNSENNNGGQA